MLNRRDDIDRGTENMLARCGGLRTGDRLLLIHETAGLGYYDDGLAGAIEARARAMGLKVTRREVGFSPEARPPAPDLAQAMTVAALTVFLARLGDQIRFSTLPGDLRALVCYALDRDMLGSSFGTLDHHRLVALRDTIDRALRDAADIHVTCPAGTDFRGMVDPAGPAPADTSTIRFPLSVFTPIPAARFAGRVAQRGFLVGTGSQYYQPYACRLDGTLMVDFDGNRITGFSGATGDVARARSHYATVADRFGIDALFVHSWHAGIHPGCSFAPPARASFERWSGGAFGNPRLMHLHTCGGYAPGEISLNILDATIRLDGVAVWQQGRLFPGRVAGGAAILDSDPALRAAFDAPAQACGLGPGGGLSFG